MKTKWFNIFTMVSNAKPMKNKKHIVWYADVEKLDFTHPWIRKWWIEQVLIHGTMEDVAELDFEEIRTFLPTLNLSKEVKNLWEDYFSWKNSMSKK